MPTWLRIALFVFNLVSIAFALWLIGSDRRVVGWALAMVNAAAIGFRLGEGF